MSAEQLGNLGATTVGIGGSPAVGGYTAGSGTLNVVSTSGSPPFSTSAPFRVVIQDQTTGLVKALLKVTAIASSTQFTVTAEVYAGVSIDNDAAQGDNVYQVQSGGSLDAIRADANRTVTGALPTDGRKGDQLNPTDDLVRWVHDGSAFNPFGPSHPLKNPQLKTWSWVNQGGASVVNAADSIFLTGVADSGANIRARVHSVTPPYSIVACIIPLVPKTTFAHVGVLFRESGSGKIVEVDTLFDNSNVQHLTGGKYTSPTAFSSGLTLGADCLIANAYPLFFRLSDDNVTNRTFDFSIDGVNWIQLFQEGRTTFITADQIGFFVDANGASKIPYATVIGWG